MSTATKNPFVSFANAYCGLVADQISDLSTEFDKAVTKSNALFNELATRGEAVEADLKNAIPRSNPMNSTLKNWFDAFSFGSAQRDKELDQLSKKVDDLIEQVAILAEKKAKQAVAAKKPAARRTATKSTTAAKATASKAKAAPAKSTSTSAPKAKSTTTRKPAAKKATTTRKPAARKTTSKATTDKAE